MKQNGIPNNSFVEHTEIRPSGLKQYRAITFQLTNDTKIKSIDQVVDFINRRGFAFFWPIKGVLLPSLWTATAGDRPIPDFHDDPGHITWDWKDRLLGKKRCYYARLLRRRNTFISLECLPYFYALSPNFGDPEQDYLDQYEQGLMTRESRQVYEALLTEGPLDTIALRKEARLANNESYGRFNKALDDLQREFKILPVGVSQAGAWHYSFIYDAVHRHFPNIIEDAGRIQEPEARDHLLNRYYQSVGAAPLKEAARLFGWKSESINRSFSRLESEGLLKGGFHMPDSTEEWIVTPSLLTQQ